MDAFLWWSGVAAWGTLAVFGLLAIGDAAIDWAVNSLWTQREFMAFVWERLRAARR